MMELEQFVITGFSMPYYAVDPKGRKIEMENRYAACFIITVSGAIRITYGEGTVVSSPAHPVFLPRGLSYSNVAIEDAESYVFNFRTLSDGYPPCELSAVPEIFVRNCFETVKNVACAHSAQSFALGLHELYSLVHALFSAPTPSGGADHILDTAIQYMRKHHTDPELRISEVAAACYVSEIYLRKLMQRRLGTTPFRVLTDIRMKQARLLAREKRPIKEIAPAVGYSDVFSFSRAYKHYFGIPPSET